jgi:pimeloyl-ACP methyl ester carboxylesterase
MLRFLKWIGKFILLPLCALLVLTLAGLWLYRLHRQSQTRENSRITTIGGIDMLHTVTLGGLPQWVQIRGQNQHNPVLLFLHGGPGSPETPFVRHYNGGLEKYFTVVTWEQRGAGKSFSSDIPDSTMHVSHFLDDTDQLVKWLQKRFGQPKIYLVGHSWGSVLGMLAIQRHPEDFLAYVGIGQVVDMQQNEALSYEYVLNTARKRNDQKAIGEMVGIGPPVRGAYAGGMESLLKQRNWLTKFGGSLYGKSDANEVITHLFFAYEYSVGDLLNYGRGALFSLFRLWNELMDINLVQQVPSVQVPVYFCVGRSDYQTPFTLVEKYFQQLEAPHKELIWFEKSAHSPLYEEPNRFQSVMVDKVLKQTTTASP